MYLQVDSPEYPGVLFQMYPQTEEESNQVKLEKCTICTYSHFLDDIEIIFPASGSLEPGVNLDSAG